MGLSLYLGEGDKKGASYVVPVGCSRNHFATTTPMGSWPHRTGLSIRHLKLSFRPLTNVVLATVKGNGKFISNLSSLDHPLAFASIHICFCCWNSLWTFARVPQSWLQDHKHPFHKFWIQGEFNACCEGMPFI